MLIVLLCGLFCTSISVIAQTSMNPTLWAEDVDYLATRLPKAHKNLFFKLAKPEFTQMAAALKQDLPTLSEDQILVRLAQLVAAIGDSHTWISLKMETAYPLSFYAFDDGLYLLQADPLYSQALHCRLTKVDGQDISDVTATLSTVIPHENPAQLKNVLPQYLIFPSMLTGLSIIKDASAAVFTFKDRDGSEFDLNVQPIQIDSGLKLIGKVNYQPLYLKHRDRSYWWEYLAENKAVYLNYSSCRDIEGYPVRQFTNEVLNFIDDNPVEKLIVDLRMNSGGNSRLLDPFIARLAQNKKLNQSGKIYVIIGRRTFSSAILNALSLKDKTAAIFVGEPTGGKPNHYGEVKSFTLPNSGLRVSYSTKFFRNSTIDTDALMPDLEVTLSLANFEAGRDPVIETILLSH